MADPSLELLPITEYDCYPLANWTECWATISVQAVQQLQKSTERRPVDIVAVIDKSDSMNEGKKCQGDASFHCGSMYVVRLAITNSITTYM